MVDLLIITNDQIGYTAGLFDYYNHFKLKGFNVKVVCIDRGMPKLIDDTSIVYIKKSNAFYNRLNLTKEASKVKTKNIYIKYFSFCFLIALLNKSKSKILDIRTVSVNPNKLKRFLSNRFMKFETSFFDRVQLITILMNRYLNVSLNKIFLVSLASDPVTDKEELVTNTNMIYVGAIAGRGLETLYRDLGNSAVFKTSDSIFNVVGYNDENIKNDHTSIIKEYGLENHIKLHGFKLKKDIVDLFKNSSIGIAYLPETEFYNVQPSTKIYEYLVNGLTVISTRTEVHLDFNSNPNVNLTANNNFVKSAEDLIVNGHKLNRASIYDNSKIYYWSQSVISLENEIK